MFSYPPLYISWCYDHHTSVYAGYQQRHNLHCITMDNSNSENADKFTLSDLSFLWNGSSSSPDMDMGSTGPNSNLTKDFIDTPEKPNSQSDLHDNIIDMVSHNVTDTSHPQQQQQGHQGQHGPSIKPSDNPVVISSHSPTAADPHNIPRSGNYPGPHGFTIDVEEQPKKTKAPSWTYSKELSKLFIKPNNECPVHFITAMTPPPGSIVRAMAMFTQSVHVNEPVHSCPTHAKSDTNVAPASETHLVHCMHPLSRYHTDTKTERHSVLVPLVMPQEGATVVKHSYKFCCSSSCVGGLNRRPIKLVLTLEHDNKVLGRQAVEVRVCACPGRDAESEEKQVRTTGGAHGAKRKRKTREAEPVVDDDDDDDESEVVVKRARLAAEDDDHIDGVYRLQVSCRKTFELLRKLRDRLVPADDLRNMMGGGGNRQVLASLENTPSGNQLSDAPIQTRCPRKNEADSEASVTITSDNARQNNGGDNSSSVGSMNQDIL